jgi:valyl-tRNA synthetase
VNVEAEQERLSKEAADIERQIARLSQMLAGPFAERAPAEVVQKERDRLSEMQASHREISSRLQRLG